MLTRIGSAWSLGKSIAENRTILDRLARFVGTPPGTRIAAVEWKGIKGEWIEPAALRGHGVLLYFHGGAFCIGSPRSHRHVVSRICRLTGLPAFVLEYRLAPEHRFPAALEDCIAAFHYLMQRGYSAFEIAFVGDSAGGTLVLTTMLSLRERGEPLPACAVCVSPVADLDRSDPESVERDLERSRSDAMLRIAVVRPMRDAYLGSADRRNPLASPAYADFVGLPPLLVQAGGQEMLLPDAELIAAAARAAGVQVELQVYPGMWHTFQNFVPYLPDARKAIARIARFLETKLRLTDAAAL